MSDPSGTPWSNNPNAPHPIMAILRGEGTFHGISRWLNLLRYADPCTHLRPHHARSIQFLGIVGALFFQCMSVLLSAVNPIRRAIKWALVVHTMAMFAFLTIPLGISLYCSSFIYIDNREFPGNDEYSPGPIGYDVVLNPKATSTVFFIMFPLNQWLADGLLVGLVSNSVSSVFHLCRSSSCIDALSFIP